MSIVTTGTQTKCNNREIIVQKEWPRGRYTIDAGKKHVEAQSWNDVSDHLKKLGCKDDQIADMAKDLDTYYMSE